MQGFTASKNHCTKIASAKENDKNQKKFDIDQLNSKACDKTGVNKNSDNKERDPQCIPFRGNVILRGNAVCISLYLQNGLEYFNQILQL